MSLLLLFNLEGKKRRGIRKAAESLGIRCRIVPTEDFGKTIGVLTETDASDADISPCSFSEEMLILHELSGSQLNAFLDILRKEDLQVALKAVSTESNRSWTAARLCEELKAEHSALQRIRNAR